MASDGFVDAFWSLRWIFQCRGEVSSLSPSSYEDNRSISPWERSRNLSSFESFVRNRAKTDTLSSSTVGSSYSPKFFSSQTFASVRSCVTKERPLTFSPLPFFPTFQLFGDALCRLLCEDGKIYLTHYLTFRDAFPTPHTFIDFIFQEQTSPAKRKEEKTFWITKSFLPRSSGLTGVVSVLSRTPLTDEFLFASIFHLQNNNNGCRLSFKLPRKTIVLKYT